MAEEEIVIRIVADDSELVASLANISDQAEGLDGVMGDVSENIADGFDAGGVEDYGHALGGAEKNTKKLEGATKKNTRSMSKFNRGAGRGVSMLGRLGGAAGGTAGRLGSMGAMMAGTPFGAFVIGAGAAGLAFSFLKNTLSITEILKATEGINKLNTSISNLEFQSEQVKIDLSFGTDEEKRLLLRKAINKAIKKTKDELFEISIQEEAAQSGLLAAQKKGGSGRAEILKIQTELGELEEKRLKTEIAKDKLILKNQKLFQEGINAGVEARKKAKADEDKAAADRKKNAIATDKLFRGLIRGELKVRLAALEDVRKARDEQAKLVIKDDKELKRFLKESDKVFEEDKAQTKREFNAAELKARQTLMMQFVTDEKDIEILAAEDRATIRAAEIEIIGKNNEEKATLKKLNAEKLAADLAAINKKFTEQENTETLANTTEAIDTEQATAEAILNAKQEAARQVFAQVKRSEEEITEFEKLQLNERERAEINFQKNKLELIKKTNKLITKEGTALIDAQILELETKLKGIGTVVQKTDTPEKGKDKDKGGGLARILGVKEEEEAAANAALQNILDKSVELIQKAVAERIAALQKEVDFRNGMIQEKQKNLENEIELNKLGKASNIALAQEELKEQNKLRDKALREKKEAQEAQFAIDTALQASSLAVAIAQLYASLSSTVVGVGIATALSALMIASFIGAKAQAATAAGFAEGGYTGNSIGGGKYEPAGTVHRGEYVIDKDTTTALGLQRVPMSEFSDVMGEHFSDMPSGQTVGKKNGKITSRLNTQIRQHKQQLLLSYEKGIKNALNGQNSILKGILAATENTPIVFPLGADKYLIERGKNKKEIKRIKK